MAQQQYQSVQQLESKPNSGQGTTSIFAVEPEGNDPRALTAHKSNRLSQQISDAPPQDVDNSDAKSEQLQSLTLENNDGKDASSTNAVNGRKNGARYRVRRQDVRFMKRGAARQLPDNKSELPLAATDGGWQRFQTVEQRSEQMNSIS